MYSQLKIIGFGYRVLPKAHAQNPNILRFYPKPIIFEFKIGFGFLSKTIILTIFLKYC